MAQALCTLAHICLPYSGNPSAAYPQILTPCRAHWPRTHIPFGPGCSRRALSQLGHSYKAGLWVKL